MAGCLLASVVVFPRICREKECNGGGEISNDVS